MKLTDLGTFEGARVTRSSVKVTNAGDGLSAAMNIEPVAYERHQRIVVVLDCEVTDVTFTDGDMSDAVTRVHKLKAGTAVVVERSLVAKMLDQQAEAIKQAKEDAAGIQRLDGVVPEVVPKKRAPRAPRKRATT